MILVLVLLGIILGGWAAPAEAVCGGSSPTRIAASASRTEVNDCVTAAASGDTISVPSGSASWSSAIALPGNKDLTLVGATVITCSGTEGTTGYTCTSGTTTTTLTCANGCFGLNLAANHTITGFTMTNSGNELISCSTGEQAIGKHFRVHRNHLISTGGWAPIRCYGQQNGVHPQGIWDHNRLQDVSLHTNGTNWNWDDGAGTYQHALWAQQTIFGGSSGVVYTEANHWTSVSTNATDGNYGCRRVERFNHIAKPGVWDFEVHGMQGENRGCQRMEVYHNATDGGTGGGFSEMRGGTGVYFSNSVPSGRFGINLTIDRSEYDESAGNFGRVKECGTGGADGNSPSGVDQQTSGQNGWRCRDQVGTSHDASQWSHSGSGGPPYGAWNQVQRPVYFWRNIEGAGAMEIAVNPQGDIESKIVVNREFYCDGGMTGCNNGVRVGTLVARPATCTTGQAYWVTDRGKWRKDTAPTAADGVLHRCSPNNTWSAYYIPHPYPHPWIDGNTSFVSNPAFVPGAGGGSVPAAPGNLSVTP